MKNKLSIRLNRIKGQIVGLRRMIEIGEDCEKIIIQFQASKAALDSAFAEFLKSNLQQCLRNSNKKNLHKINKILKALSQK